MRGLGILMRLQILDVERRLSLGNLELDGCPLPAATAPAHCSQRAQHCKLTSQTFRKSRSWCNGKVKCVYMYHFLLVLIVSIVTVTCANTDQTCSNTNRMCTTAVTLTVSAVKLTVFAVTLTVSAVTLTVSAVSVEDVVEAESERDDDAGHDASREISQVRNSDWYRCKTIRHYCH